MRFTKKSTAAILALTSQNTDKLIGLAVHVEEGFAVDSLGCIVNCWVEKKALWGNSNKAAYGGCIDHSNTSNKTLSAGAYPSANTADREHAHKVIEAAAEVGIKLRHDVVDYFKCLLEEHSQACIVAIMERHVPDSVKSGAYKGSVEYGAKKETIPTVNTTITEPVVTMSTKMLVNELSKVREFVNSAEEAIGIDAGKGDTPASPSVLSVTGRSSPHPVEA